MTDSPIRILFVCTGNICRSPLAEGIFNTACKKQNLDGAILVGSAGTGAWHVGEKPDNRSQRIALCHGIELKSRARQFTSKHLEENDLILAMDQENYKDLLSLAGPKKKKIKLMREYDSPAQSRESVPDPFYGSEEEFEQVFKILDRCCRNLLVHIKDVYQLTGEEIGSNS